MNKMSCTKKLFLAIGILFAVAILFLHGPVSAAISYPPSQTTQSMGVPSLVGSTAAPGVLFDNFEYWETPQNHGWIIKHPGMTNGYPVWGIGVGTGTIETVVDFQQGSRVLEAYMPATLFVPDIERFTIIYNPTIEVNIPDFSVFTLKMRSPVAIETFDTYEIVILTSDGIEFHLVPRANSNGALYPELNPEANAVEVAPTLGGAAAIRMNVGREAADGSWHQIAVDLAEAYGIVTNTAMPDQNVFAIYIMGNQYRMDDMMLQNRTLASRIGIPPYLFHINHIYQQIFDSQFGGTTRYIFVSDAVGDAIYPIADYSNHIGREHVVEHGYGNTAIQNMMTPGSDIRVLNSELWIDHKINQGAFSVAVDAAQVALIDPALTAAEYATAVANFPVPLDADGNVQSLAQYKVSNPVASISLGIGALVAGVRDAVVLPAVDVYTLDSPQLLEPTLAVGPTTPDGGVNNILFSANIGGAHDLGTCADGFIQPVPLNEPLRYIPLYCHSSALECCGGTNNGFLGTTEINLVAQSLMLAGYTTWPAVAKIVIPPEQIMENLILTVVASNGLAEDVEALSIITTNYPVTSYPPVIEDVDDQIFYVGNGPQSYQLNATDADSFTINSAGQLGRDMDNMIWAATLNGLASYMYGPWTESLIDQKSGLVTIEPQFEGTFELVASVRDGDGGEAVAAFNIYCVNSQTWLNHAPVLLGDWDHPMLGYAGSTLTLDMSGIVDPDGEELYYSCNIGTIGVRPGHEGHVVWEFQTMYPGTYMVEIVAYDTRGGYIVVPQEVIISPWWSI